jgi:hypothetical protein
MHFISPVFLLALCTLAIPILIHLFYFRKYKKILFSDIKFLKEVLQQKSNIDNLKKRLILAMRLLALFFLVLAFAQPFFGKKNKNDIKGNTAACIYIDNSYSTTLQKGNSSVLDIAIQKAKEIAQSFDVNDRLYLMTNDINFNNGWLSKNDFLNAVDNIKIATSSKNLDEIITKQNAILSNIAATQKWRIIISDFQENMVKSNIDTSYTTYLLPIQTENKKNIYIDSCWLAQPIVLLNNNNKLLYKINNASDKSVENIAIDLKINNQIKALNRINLDANASKIDSFNFTISQPGIQQLEIGIKDYPITYDDRFYATFQVLEHEKVLSIQEQITPNNIEAIFQNDAYFILEKNNINQVDYSKLNQYKFIIFNHINEISSGLSNAIKDYVQSGGILFIIPSDNISISSYNALFNILQMGNISQIKEQQLSVKTLNLKENIFKGIFTETPKNIDFPNISKYYPFQINSNAQHYSIIPTNATTSLINKFVIDKGLVYLQAAPLIKEYIDLGNKAIYAPLVYNMAIYQQANIALYYTIGKNNLIELKNIDNTNNQIISLSNNRYEFIPENRSIGNNLILNINQAVQSDGIYNIQKDQENINQAIALNFDRAESKLNFISDDELRDKFKHSTYIILDNKKSNLQAQVKQIKDGIVLWKFCVILALIFLFAEIMIIRFMK